MQGNNRLYLINKLYDINTNGVIRLIDVFIYVK